ncbi:hypothetical protein CPB83DRAFT_862417 [Crepidotus variabilis]|uniref:Uncharacterized protein n=1 Tax=Crepidotus variabilis TaxID=179855 RepID=A0A9P6E7E2_9AGAR|nr:hypothetical protein CPB83DRAFT_862417 [Crepidotus variabilis]
MSDLAREEAYFIVAGFTIMAWDILENIPADIRLFHEHSIQLPSLIYSTARTFTLALFVFFLVVDLAGGFGGGPTGLPYFCFPVFLQMRFWHSISWLFTILLTIQRTLTSSILYLRVRALYKPNPRLPSFFLLLLVNITVVSVLLFGLPGVGAIAFDLLKFIAVLWKLGRRPALYADRPMKQKSGLLWSFWVPFRRRRMNQVTDRMLQDTLLYLLLAIAIKIPQFIWLVRSTVASDWTLYTFYLDTTISCVISSKIFRDMKLGLPGLSEGPVTSTQALTQSKLDFVVPVSQVLASNLV